MANLRDLSQLIEKFRGIGVSDDLHPKEREEIKRLIEEAKQDVAAGNDCGKLQVFGGRTGSKAEGHKGEEAKAQGLNRSSGSIVANKPAGCND